MASRPSIFLIVVLAIVVHGVSCLTVDAKPIVKPSSNRLVGKWNIVEANGIAIANLPVVEFTDTRVRYTYCNVKEGSYTLRGNTISFGLMMSTLMLCTDITPSEGVVDQAFQDCKQIKFSRTGLDCFSARQKKVLVLTR